MDCITPVPRRLIGALLAAVALIPAARGGDDVAPARVERARTILRLFLDGKHEEFVATGDAAVRKAFTPQMSAGLAELFSKQYGKFEREESFTAVRRNNFDCVTFLLRYANGTLKLEVVLDADEHMSGFWNRGGDTSSSYKAPAYVAPDKFSVQDATVKCGEFELPGKLALPKTASASSRVPALVLVHGSGPNDEDETILGNKPFRDLAEGLASRGVAVLRYEKRTHKYAEKITPKSITLDQEVVDDAAAAAELLRGRPEIDPARVYVLGHSLGGTMAPRIAARDPKLAGIVVLAGAGRPLLDVVIDQIEYISRTDGDLSEDEKTMLDELRRSVAAIRAGRLDDMKAPILGAPSEYWQQLDRVDAPAEAAKLSLPILVLQGGRDYQVDMKSFENWKKALSGRRNVTLHCFDKLNHLMVAGEGPSTPKEYETPGHVDAQVIETIAKWIDSQAVRP